MSQKHRIHIDTYMRIFRTSFGSQISWDRASGFDPGSVLELGVPIARAYDHRPKLALTLITGNDDEYPGGCFVLYEELSPAKQAEVRRLFPDHPDLMTIH